MLKQLVQALEKLEYRDFVETFELFGIWNLHPLNM
jgi:hypothetical protein